MATPKFAMSQEFTAELKFMEMALKYLQGKWCEGFAPERKKNNENGYAKLKSLEEEFYK